MVPTELGGWAGGKGGSDLWVNRRSALNVMIVWSLKEGTSHVLLSLIFLHYTVISLDLENSSCL